MRSWELSGHMRTSLRDTAADFAVAARARWRSGGPVIRIRTSRPNFTLTFDDGPDPVHTNRLMQTLERHGVRCTFFVLGTRARKYPRVLRDLVDGGHEIGLHGAFHEHLSNVSIDQLRKQLADMRDVVVQQLQRPIVWYRAPYGYYSEQALQVCSELDLIPVTASRTARDWEDISITEQIRTGTSRPRRGNIILLHDSIAGREDGADRALAESVGSADLVSAILDKYNRRGLTAVTLSDLARDGSLVR